jgi:hypothetical protein
MTDEQINKIVEAIDRNTEAIHTLQAAMWETIDGSQDKAGVKDAIFDVAKKLDIVSGAINGEHEPGKWK